MRIIIKILPKETFVYEDVNKYFIHSFIWNLLKDTEFSKLHDIKKFKFFTFSNIFPVSDFKFNDEKQFIVSSPNKYFIHTLADKLQNLRNFKLGIHEFELSEFKKFSMELKQRWQSSTPIVLYENNKSNTYYSIKRNPDLNFFLERLKDNAIKKFNAFYNKNFIFDGPLFDRLFFKKQVATHIRKNQKEFLFLGTLWEFELNLPRIDTINEIDNEKRNFYEFIMDCGLGEKNSLGFGFVNMVRKYEKWRNNNTEQEQSKEKEHSKRDKALKALINYESG